MKSAQEKFQLRDVERGGRAATEINCRWKEQGPPVSSPLRRSSLAHCSLAQAVDRLSLMPLQFTQYRFTKTRCLRAVEQILVKSAVWADTRAERNVNIEMVDHIICSGGIWPSRIAPSCATRVSALGERRYRARVVIGAVTHK